MIDLGPERLHRTTVDLVAELDRDPGMHGEVLRAQRQFFAGAPDYLPQGEAHAAAHGRFCEWFVLERESEHLGAVPVEVVEGLPDAVRLALRSSVCGLFLVEATEPYVRVRDVAGGTNLELHTDAPLGAGDLVVGRLYPGEVDAMTPSPSAAILRQGAAVAGAVQRDLERAGLARRLTQAELEAVLFRNVGELAAAQARRVPPERLEARLDSLLREGGDRNHSAADISDALEAAREGPGSVMGPLLEELAFDTDVDLESMRTTMLELWNEHRLRAMEREPATAPPAAVQRADDTPSPVEADGRGLGAVIAARIERGLAEHEDIEALFADVDNMIGGGEEDDDEAGEGIESAAAGDLDALVQEYLWEREVEPGSAAQTTLAAFVEHQTGLPVPGVYLEAIPARELVSFLLRAFLAAAPSERAARVRAAFAALAAFYAWAEDTQAYELTPALDGCRQALVEPLDRLQRASVVLSQPASGATPLPRVLRVQRIDGGEFEVVGSETPPTWIDAPEAAPDLRADDLLLAAVLSDGRGGLRFAGPVTVLPAAAADLLE